MNRREEEKAALARKAAEAQFMLNTKKAAAPSEREMELEALALKTERLRALRLARESAKTQARRR